ncbi:hypothetical protein E2C01_028987 [Portunus trituberculatus]|uniref:Uncharacterized protein n=1 Tax=Portunus trituberculatus TaxID=210409 RepID=A0A5B7EN01_PORTR|nr:hypothetical protein [Portunus trituberculatus]
MLVKNGCDGEGVNRRVGEVMYIIRSGYESPPGAKPYRKRRHTPLPLSLTHSLTHLPGTRLELRMLDLTPIERELFVYEGVLVVVMVVIVVVVVVVVVVSGVVYVSSPTQESSQGHTGRLTSLPSRR